MEAKGFDPVQGRGAAGGIGRSKIILFTAGMFGVLLILVWLNEILDLPHHLMGAPDTPVNWRESLLESIVVLALGLITLFELRHDLLRARRAEAALRQSEEKFRTFADFTYDWETWEAPDGSLVFVSPSCQRITGKTQEEFTKNPGLMAEIVHPDDLNSFLDHRKIDQSQAEPSHIDFRIITPEGRERWISHNCQPVYGADGSWLGRRSSNRDISIRKGLISDLEKALAEVKVLRGLLPICAHCKRVRDDEGLWQKIEDYIEDRSEALFTHGLCPDCTKLLYPELEEAE
ncbi:MAG: PAS domain-containing protein [Pseudomonadota bacterium]